MVKNKLKIKSKNYFAHLRIKKTKKDGEYYDVVFGLKGHKKMAKPKPRGQIYEKENLSDIGTCLGRYGFDQWMYNKRRL